MYEIYKRTWAEIDLDALEENYRALRAALKPGVRFLGVVKADAYGHGAVKVSLLLQDLGADYLAVSNLDEALQLRHGGVTLPILLLGYTEPIHGDVLIRNGFTQTVFDLEDARRFSQTAEAMGQKLKVHVKVDTGMSRLGFLCDEEGLEQARERVLAVDELPGLELEGLFTHLSVSDTPGGEEYTRMQFDRFLTLRREVEERRGKAIPICHCANSGAVANYPEMQLDMVRPGLLLYGLYPDPEAENKLGLRPAMAVKTTVASVKELAADTSVSYGRTRTLERSSRVAVLPIGYADGLMRNLSDRYSVLVRGQEAPILGRICMDMCMVDVTEIPDVRTGDEVEVFGPHLPVERAAQLLGTISYELLCSVSKRVPRLYWQKGAVCGRMMYIE